MRFGFLSTLDNLLLPHLINTALENGLENIYVILDSKNISEKDKTIWERRTNGNFGYFSSLNKSLMKLKKLNMPLYFVENHNSEESINLYEKLQLNCLFNAGTPRKIGSRLLDPNIIPDGVINIHPGKLPEYRGCSCVEWAIINDDPIFNTVHYMDVEYDTGPIIKTEKYNFNTNSSYVDIRTQVYLEGCRLSCIVLKGIQDKIYSKNMALIQDESKSKFWHPIPIDIEEKSIKKANNHRYKYQIL